MSARVGPWRVAMKIVFFDGYCSLCNSLIDWLLQIDTTGKLKFASLQGKTATTLLNQGSWSVNLDTIVYLRNEKKITQSSAVLAILSDLGGIWAMTKILYIVPKFLRDFFYKIIANHRYRIFGKRDSCRMPTSEERERLLP